MTSALQGWSLMGRGGHGEWGGSWLCKNPALRGDGGAATQCAHHSASWATLWTCIQAAPPPRGDSLVAQTSHCIQAGCRQGFACSAIDPGLIPGLGRSPGEGNGYPLQYSCLKNVMDRRSLAGHSPWGHKESDVAEWLTLSPTLRKVGMQQGAGRRDTLP